ncbi:MAG: glycoside hydrolase family 25 protein [Sporolactobacillus sp.]
MRFFKWFSLIFMIALTFTLASTAMPHKASAASNAAPTGWIDTIQNGGVLSGTQAINGWFLDNSSVKLINILVDGKVVGTTTETVNRPDVIGKMGALGYGYAGDLTSGFSYSLNTTAFSDGQHALAIQEIGSSGSGTTCSLTVSIHNTNAWIDTVQDGATVSGATTVGGWYFDSAGVNHLNVLIDNQQVAQTTETVDRPDVVAAMKQLGFTNFNAQSNYGFNDSVDFSTFSNGPHTLTIQDVNANGIVASSCSRVVTVKNVSPTGWIDTIQNGSVLSGTQAINGWFLDNSGVKQISATLTDAKGKTYSIGQTSANVARPDVIHVMEPQGYSANQNSDPGFSIPFNTTKFSDGTYTLTIQEIGNSGNGTTCDLTVSIHNTNAWIDTVQDGATVSGATTVGGWYFDSAGVNHLNVLIDNQQVAQTTETVDRPDVVVAMKQLGFTNFNAQSSYGFNVAVDFNALSNGQHTLTIQDVNSNDIVSSSCSRVVTVKNEPPTGWIESVQSGNTLYGTHSISGWFLDNSGIKQISATLIDANGKSYSIGQTTGTAARPDVIQSMQSQGYLSSQNPTPGFSIPFDTTKFSDGTYTLNIEETGNNGAQVNKSFAIAINNHFGSIDTLANNASIAINQPINGWFLDASGVKSIEVFVDNQSQGFASYGSSRPDVAAAYPDLNISSCGYTFFLNTSSISPGQHTLQLKELGNDNTTTTITRDFYSNLPLGVTSLGVDISHYQGSIDFTGIRQAGVGFVIAKATEGTTYVDPTFAGDIAVANAAGLDTDAYHFLDNTTDPNAARAEANHFADVIGTAGLSGYAFVDVESFPTGATQSQVTSTVAAFLDQLKTRGITKIGVYASYNAFQNLIDVSTVKSYGALVWVARYRGDSTYLGPGMNADLWQWTRGGSINGISGSVDTDYSFVDGL